jgi:hypothetical protein
MSLIVLYNIFAGAPRDIFYPFELPNGWVHLKSGTKCFLAHRDECNCDFIFYEEFKGSKYSLSETKTFLFDLFNHFIHEGIVINFKISEIDN